MDSRELEERTLFENLHGAEPGPPWRHELSARVRDFRRRRAHLRGERDEEPGLDFEAAGPDDVPDARATHAEELAPSAVAPPAAYEPSFIDELNLDSTAERGQAESLRFDDRELPGGGEALEIPLGPSDQDEEGTWLTGRLPIPPAPLGQRALAGLVDLLVLLAGAGIFAVIVWRAAGQVSSHPLNVVVFLFVVAFFIVAYFGLFTTLAFATPGQLWVGLEVRNFFGDYPSPGESAWRAFGYLVSIGALLLGFIWAVLDAEHLAWHDHISSTYLVEAVPDHELATGVER